MLKRRRSEKLGVVRSAVVGQEKFTPFHFPVGGLEVHDSSVFLSTPPFCSFLHIFCLWPNQGHLQACWIS